jgi:hypothetical protein
VRPVQRNAGVPGNRRVRESTARESEGGEPAVFGARSRPEERRKTLRSATRLVRCPTDWLLSCRRRHRRRQTLNRRMQRWYSARDRPAADSCSSLLGCARQPWMKELGAGRRLGGGPAARCPAQPHRSGPLGRPADTQADDAGAQLRRPSVAPAVAVSPGARRAVPQAARRLTRRPTTWRRSAPEIVESSSNPGSDSPTDRALSCRARRQRLPEAPEFLCKTLPKVD